MNKIYIGNLPFSLNEHDLESIFSEFGAIEDVFLVRDRATKRLKGFGFITFGSEEEAKKAIDEMNGKELKGRTIKVSMAIEKDKE